MLTVRTSWRKAIRYTGRQHRFPPNIFFTNIIKIIRNTLCLLGFFFFTSWSSQQHISSCRRAIYEYLLYLIILTRFIELYYCKIAERFEKSKTVYYVNCVYKFAGTHRSHIVYLSRGMRFKLSSISLSRKAEQTFFRRTNGQPMKTTTVETIRIFGIRTTGNCGFNVIHIYSETSQ